MTLPPIGAWLAEAGPSHRDPICGALVRQLTTREMPATNIYCEDPYCSSVSGHLAVLRNPVPQSVGKHTEKRPQDHPFAELWVLDPATNRSALIDANISVRATGQHAYGDFFFYFSGEGHALMRLCLSTLETCPVWQEPADEPALACWGSMSPDNRYLVSRTCLPSGIFQVVVLDIESGTLQVIAEAPDLCNPHPRFDRMTGDWILVQWNRGWHEKRPRKQAACGDMGATLFLAARDGSARREIPIAKPDIPHGVSGHEAWIKDEPEFVYSLSPLDPPYEDGARKGNLVSYRIGDSAPRLLAHDPGTYYGHVSTSQCGRYWVCDGWKWDETVCEVPPWIAVGSTRTGKFAPLCHVGGYMAHFETGHAHPYMAPDAASVIFTSTRSGIPQVYAAELPAGFLEALGS